MSEWLQQQKTTPIMLAQAHGVTATAHTVTRPPEPPVAESSQEPKPWSFFPYSAAAFIIIVLLVIIGTRRLKLVPKGLQNMLEMVYEGLYSLPEMVMGPRGRQYAPFVCTFFIYIIVMNAMGLIPLLKSATASLSITLGMALVAFVGVQYFGFKAQGAKYLAHFLGPVPWMAVLILPLEIISEFVRPVSLSMRLYGNIFGEEQVVSALAHNLTPFSPLVILPLQLLTVFLQAFVFTLLVTVYIALATEHGSEHEEAEAASVHA